MSSASKGVPEKLSHYRLIEQIGAGGMGVVYLAHDEHLQRDVGLKVLPAGSLADETARKRFRKEALSLAKLNHPNIATVHEFGSDSNTDFLVTEYIAGTTLSSKLQSGALPAEEVYRLGIQLTQGLAAAHDQGVVHRDLKPSNLRLTPDGRLKILDFGLAQLMPHASGLSAAASVTQSQEISGTLPYMAPEQLKGEKADPRNDVWSAGAVLYEMATGKRPFPQTNPSLLINAILNEAPAPPSSLAHDVPPQLDRIILKALAKSPEQRYQSARDLTADLQLQGMASGPPGRRGRWPWLALGAAAALAIAIGGYALWHLRKAGTPAAPAAQTPHRRAVAVLGFKNLSGDPTKTWLSTALSEMLTTELGEGDQLRTVPGESVANMKISLSLPEADSFSQKTLHRIGQNLGSDDVVVGSYLPVGEGQLRVDLRLQDTATGETLATVSERGSEAQIDDLVAKAGDQLRGDLGVAPLSEAQTASVRASLPSNPEAARLYSQGLQALRLFDSQSARNLLERASQIEPSYAATHSALAAALSALGYDDQAKEQAQKALDLSAQASREERLQIEGRSHRLLGQLPEAIDNYRALFEFFPDDVDYGIALIGVQVAGGRVSDAEATLAQLRQLKVSEADAARIDISDAEIGGFQGDMKREQAQSDRAVQEGKAIGANLLVAEALLIGGEARNSLGQPDKARSQIDQAKVFYTAAGDQRGVGRALLSEGDIEFDQGKFNDARADFDRGLAAFQKIGAQRSIRNSYERIGNVLYAQGKPKESTEFYDKALQFDLTVHEPSNLASDYGNIANAMDDLGELDGAMKMQQQALDAFTKLNDKKGETETLYNIGNLDMELGRTAEGKKYFEDALAMAREIDYRESEPYPVEGLASVLHTMGDSAGAEKQYEQALAMCDEMKNSGLATRIHLSQASISVDSGNFAEGEKRSRDLLTALDKSNPGAMAEGLAILARSLLGEGKTKEARDLASQAVALAEKSNAKPAYFEAALADGRVKAKTGQYAEGHQELASAFAKAHKFGYLLYEDELRLALGDIELDAKALDARARLSALEHDARAQGNVDLANRAHALVQK
jgi:eukaryotic-like serine/threonine-protein kinase